MVDSPSRRDLLRSGAALTALTGLAGCSDLLGSLGGNGSSGSLGPVPDGASFTVSVDADAVRTDEGTKTIANAWFEGRAKREYVDENQPTSLDEALSQFEDQFGLDPEKVSVFTAFFDSIGFYGFGSRTLGAVLTADWSPEDITESIEESAGYTYTKDEHYGQPIYQPETEEFYSFAVWLGVLADGEYVVGSESAVRNTIEVAAGDSEGIDGRLKEAYTATRDAPIRFVIDPPVGLLPDEIEREGTTVQLEPLNEVASVAGAVYENGDNRGIEVTMAADDTDTAKNLTDTIAAYRSVVEPQLTREELSTALENVSVSRDGSDVVLTYERSVDDLAATVEALASPSEDDEYRTPTASFAFDYTQRSETDQSKNYLEITHDGGDTIVADRLYFRGDGFGAASGIDASGVRATYREDPGDTWPEEQTSAEKDDEPAVAAGDSVTMQADTDYEIRVVWQPEDGDQSATLGQDSGPDA